MVIISFSEAVKKAGGSEKANVRSLGVSDRPAPQATPEAAPQFVQNVSEAQLAGAQKMGESVTRAADKFNAAGDVFGPGGATNLVKKSSALLEGALGTAAGGLETMFAPVTAEIKTLSDKISNTGAAQDLAQTAPVSALLDKVNSSIEPLKRFAEQNPDEARNIIDGINVILTIAGERIPSLKQDVKTPITDMAPFAKAAKEKAVSAFDTAKGKASELNPFGASADAPIMDATPSYSKSMVGEPAITNPDGSVTSRFTESTGINKPRTVNPTVTETAANAELTSLAGYPKAETYLNKANYVEKAIIEKASALKSSLEAEKVIRPKKEIAKTVNDAVREAAKDSLVLQKTDPIVANYMRVARKAIDQADGTLAGELRVRQALDKAYESAGGKYVNNKGMDQIHRAAREALNADMQAKASITAVRDSLKSQSNLYRALDVLQDKARAEGGSALERFVNSNPVISNTAKAAIRATGLGAGLQLFP